MPQIDRGPGHVIDDCDAVDDEEVGSGLPDLPANRRRHVIQSTLLKRREQVEIPDAIPGKPAVEKPEVADVLKHHIVRLREQRREDDAPAGGGVIEGKLVAERGLSRARRPGDQAGAASWQTSAENGVQTRHTSRHPADCRQVFGCPGVCHAFWSRPHAVLRSALFLWIPVVQV